MNINEILVDSLNRVQESVHEVLSGMSAAQLNVMPLDRCNSISWLLWHVARGQDSQIAEVAGTREVWHDGAWAESFGLPAGSSATGYGFSRRQVAALRVDSGDPLREYYDLVHARTVDYLGRLTDEDLDHVVDRHWTPPVTLGVRLVSVINDCTQHAGQAAYVKGLLHETAD